MWQRRHWRGYAGGLNLSGVSSDTSQLMYTASEIMYISVIFVNIRHGGVSL